MATMQTRLDGIPAYFNVQPDGKTVGAFHPLAPEFDTMLLPYELRSTYESSNLDTVLRVMLTVAVEAQHPFCDYCSTIQSASTFIWGDPERETTREYRDQFDLFAPNAEPTL